MSSLAAFIDLIDDRLVLVTFLPLNFVDANRLDAFQTAMLQTPRNRMFYLVVDMIPAHSKTYGHVLSAHPASPAGKKPLIRRRQLILAFRPQNTFHLHAAHCTRRMV